MLIAFEGAARSGKSTLIQWVKQHLVNLGMQVKVTEWNSYPMLQELINYKKTYFTFTPLTYSLLHLTEFAIRHEEVVQPALKQNKIVLADRWKYTAFVRDVAREIPETYVRQCYGFAKEPDIIFYLDVPATEALKRHHATKKFFGYNAGVDIRPELPVEEAFLQYHQQLTQLYEKLPEFQTFIKLDGTKKPRVLAAEVFCLLKQLRIKKILSVSS